MTHHFKVNCLRDNLKLIREFVHNALTEFPLSEIETNQLILAVDEVCSNLIIHAHNCNPETNLEININRNQDEILFEIIHESNNSFDFSKYKNPSLKKIVKERRKGGIGLILVNKIMDDVEVKHENTFNIWRMSKYIHAG